MIYTLPTELGNIGSEGLDLTAWKKKKRLGYFVLNLLMLEDFEFFYLLCTNDELN